MYAILLADEAHPNFHANDFFRVYSDYILEQLCELPGIEMEMTPVFRSELPAKKEQLKRAKIIFSNWGMPEMALDEVKAYFPQIKAVFYAGGTVAPFGAPYFQLGARVFSAGEANAAAAAEYALAHILLATKNCLNGIRMYRDSAGYHQARAITTSKQGNYQSRVGLIGVGRVGGRLAQLLSPFDLNLFASDPYLQPMRARSLNVKMCELNELFATCDVISCHLTDTVDLTDMLGYEQFSQMMPGAVFINCSQGLHVNEDGLLRALREEPRRTAILDSTKVQPLPAGHPFYDMPNVFLTPHIAGSFGGELERMGQDIVEALTAYVNNKPTRHEVPRERCNK